MVALINISLMRFSAHSDVADVPAGLPGHYSPVRFGSVQLGCASSTSISLALPCKNVFVYYFSFFFFFLICSFNLLPPWSLEPWPCISCCCQAAAPAIAIALSQLVRRLLMTWQTRYDFRALKKFDNHFSYSRALSLSLSISLSHSCSVAWLLYLYAH